MTIFTAASDTKFLHQGERLKLIDDTYVLEICDICGKERKCDWFEFCDDLRTGLDVCRSCRREMLTEVND